jgi:hypothetical protein
MKDTLFYFVTQKRAMDYLEKHQSNNGFFLWYNAEFDVWHLTIYN